MCFNYSIETKCGINKMSDQSEVITLSTPLSISQIEFRIQSINKGGYATILAYKNARVDMERLDAVHGDKWQRKQQFIDGKLYCSVGIFNKDLKEWVWREDVGTESATEKEKGQASDAFKRACFNWGIGRELYSYPSIQIKLNSDEVKNDNGKLRQTWNLKLNEWKWYSEFSGNKITCLAARDQNGVVRFRWGEIKPTFITNDQKNELTGLLLKKSNDDHDSILAGIENATGINPHDFMNGKIKINQYTIVKGLL